MNKFLLKIGIKDFFFFFFIVFSLKSENNEKNNNIYNINDLSTCMVYANEVRKLYDNSNPKNSFQNFSFGKFYSEVDKIISFVKNSNNQRYNQTCQKYSFDSSKGFSFSSKGLSFEEIRRRTQWFNELCGQMNSADWAALQKEKVDFYKGFYDCNREFLGLDKRGLFDTYAVVKISNIIGRSLSSDEKDDFLNGIKSISPYSAEGNAVSQNNYNLSLLKAIMDSFEDLGLENLSSLSEDGKAMFFNRFGNEKLKNNVGIKNFASLIVRLFNEPKEGRTEYYKNLENNIKYNVSQKFFDYSHSPHVGSAAISGYFEKRIEELEKRIEEQVKSKVSSEEELRRIDKEVSELKKKNNDLEKKIESNKNGYDKSSSIKNNDQKKECNNVNSFFDRLKNALQKQDERIKLLEKYAVALATVSGIGLLYNCYFFWKNYSSDKDE